MKYFVVLLLSLIAFHSFPKETNCIFTQSLNETNIGIFYHVTDSLPSVFPANHSDIVGSRMKDEACQRFMEFSLPETKPEHELFKTRLTNEIVKKAGITTDHTLPLDYHETGTIKMEGFTVKNIYFQTLPGVYATANLYIPDGKGPFPAVINSNGHWPGAKMCESVQSVAQYLAQNGYVSLCLDAFGAGERSTIPGIEEYHGANLGTSLLNLGKSLLGIQVSENMRAVDLLCSFPFVDTKNIGATGASGGGNQTLWLTAMDERVKAAVPVVSAGTFESYIMATNCVCELLIDGLPLTEESGILAMIAPRSVLMLNHNKEINPTFYPSEMLRTYTNAMLVYEMLGKADNLSYKIFDLEHDYLQEDRDAMLKWFNLHLKGNVNDLTFKEFVYKKLPYDKLLVFASGNRDQKVKSIQEYCIQQGEELRLKLLSLRAIDVELKKKELLEILRINKFAGIKDIHKYSVADGWDRFAIESDNGKLIPLLYLAPQDKSMGYTILCDPEGKKGISLALIDKLRRKGAGIVVIDLYGIGENSSATANKHDGIDLPKFHTLSRADLWLGRTTMGEWVEDLNLVIQFLENTYNATSVSIDATREVALAGLYLSVLKSGKVNSIQLHEAPVSYVFDTREGIDFFSMGVHIPEFLVWGNVSLACALSDANIQFVNPVTMSGKVIAEDKLPLVKAEFEKMDTLCHQQRKTVFDQENK
jgi:dienelactone hydrolase